jgi:hypothetical protein
MGLWRRAGKELPLGTGGPVGQSHFALVAKGEPGGVGLSGDLRESITVQELGTVCELLWSAAATVCGGESDEYM